MCYLVHELVNHTSYEVGPLRDMRHNRDRYLASLFDGVLMCTNAYLKIQRIGHHLVIKSRRFIEPLYGLLQNHRHSDE